MTNRHPVIIASLLLGVFAIIGTTLVSFTHLNTADRIAENERLALLNKLHQLIPAESIDNDIVNDTLIVSDGRLGTEQSLVYLGRKQNQPVAAVIETVAPDGYSGKISMLVAVKVDGTLGGVRIVSHRETPGLGDKIDESKSNWILGFSGKSLGNPEMSRWKVKRDGGDFDQFTGATITPRAVVNAIANSLAFFRDNRDRLFIQNTQPKAEPVANAQTEGNQK